MRAARSDFAFFHPLRVRWAECDAQGIVFNVNYFLYFDVAMTEWMRQLGAHFSGEDALEFFTVRAEADYLSSAVFDDELEIGVRCARIGNTSMKMVVGIFRDDELLNEGALIYVNAARGTKEKEAIPADFISRIEAFETVAPER